MTPPAGKSILIVEDDADIREAMALVLQDDGYTVARSANGSEALAYLHASPPPSLILLDLMMPVMDGWQFRQEQRRDPALAPIPVVVVSADSHVRQKAEGIGAVDHLQKPVELERLLEMVHRHC